MNKIIEYAVDMFPYMTVSAPIIVLIRILIYKIKKKEKINWHHEFGCIMFLIFMVGLSSQTFEIGPNKSLFKINIIPFKVIIDTYKEVFINGNINHFIVNFLGNIIMFMPIGFALPLLWKIKTKRVVLIGLYYSMLIEFSQLFLSRGTDIDDLWLNTLGVILGLAIYKLLNKKYNRYIYKFKY
jgi:Glycopeptide antibiotics resistance protein